MSSCSFLLLIILSLTWKSPSTTLRKSSVSITTYLCFGLSMLDFKYSSQQSVVFLFLIFAVVSVAQNVCNNRLSAVHLLPLHIVWCWSFMLLANPHNIAMILEAWTLISFSWEWSPLLNFTACFPGPRSLSVFPSPPRSTGPLCYSWLDSGSSLSSWGSEYRHG